tara:strand:- start:1125 stop:1361 length:237 start_codon:yes stop_codon:yes gene_type:complete
MSDNVVQFPQNKKWILNFIIPDEIRMEGQSSDIHWTFDQNYGTAEVLARSLDEAKKKILECITIDYWTDINMWTNEEV